MRTTQTSIFTAVLLVGFLGGRVDADESWQDHPPWLGSWHATPEVSRMLGLEQQGPDTAEKLQIEFFVSKDVAIAVAGKEMIARVESFFARRLGGKHQIVAAGQWNGKEFTADSACFVTQIEGANSAAFIRSSSKCRNPIPIHQARPALALMS